MKIERETIIKIETVVLSCSLQPIKKEEEEGQKASEHMQMIRWVQNREGEEEKLKELKGWNNRTARHQLLYSLGWAVVITDGCIGTSYLKWQN